MEIVGKSFTPDQLQAHINSLTFGAWRPRFVVVHNTSVPDRATWDGWQARNPPITERNGGKTSKAIMRASAGVAARICS